ncbi:MAG TPA: sigma-70 family RNA polymerase sigma factor [Solirubrobacteraceae bacterium]|jgi:RNA polymerase sigma-70 factor (ECF subfamily)|nr:sigma-70 family RNA polymerase sigma factor [Solirubrobacteraceae bacterium]
MDDALGPEDATRLVMRAKDGDREAFARLYAGHYDGIRRYLCCALRDVHEAEDAAQDVFVQALRALPRYEPRGYPLRRWLLRIARNVAVDRARRRRAAPADPAVLESRLHADPADRLGDVLSDHALRAHLARLPQAQRQVIFLRYAVGCDGNELATLTNRTPAAVRQIHHRAIAELRRRMPVAA